MHTFVFTLARRAAIDMLRQRSAHSTRAIAVEHLDASAGDGAFDELVLALDTRDVLESLSPKHREVLELQYPGDVAQAQIAARLDVPLGTVILTAGRSVVDLTAAVDPALYPILSVTAEPADGNPERTGPEVLRAKPE